MKKILVDIKNTESIRSLQLYLTEKGLMMHTAESIPFSTTSLQDRFSLLLSWEEFDEARIVLEKLREDTKKIRDILLEACKNSPGMSAYGLLFGDDNDE